MLASLPDRWVYAAMRQAERMAAGNIVCLLADGGLEVPEHWSVDQGLRRK